MASKVTRTCLIAVSAIGTCGLVAAQAEAAAPTIPTFLVNTPAVAGVRAVTPESATLTGVIDTGGNPGSTFSVPSGTTLTWDSNITPVILAAGTKYVDGLPSSGSDMKVPTSAAATQLNNNGADNYSTVTFEYDTAADYAANGNNPGSDTGYATEVNVPTYPDLSSVSATIGGYPAATADANGISGPLKPDTKYVYWINQQVGVTDAAQTINTYNGSATGTNPTWTCYPDSYIAAVAPYNGFTSSGTVSGGLNSSGTAQTTPQPQIQGPCLYYFGGGSNYYASPVGTFSTPSLGQLKLFGAAATFKFAKVQTSSTPTSTTVTVKKANPIGNPSTAQAALVVADQSVEKAIGSLELTAGGRSVATANFALAADSNKAVTLKLTAYGKKLIAEGKKFTAKVTSTVQTDQPIVTKSVTL